MSTIPQHDFVRVMTDADAFIESVHGQSRVGEIGVHLMAGYLEAEDRDGRELWMFHASRSDTITGESHRVIGGIVYRITFGIRSLDRAELFETEADASAFAKAFSAERVVPTWEDIRHASRRIGELFAFVAQALIARSLRYMRQQRRDKSSMNKA